MMGLMIEDVREHHTKWSFYLAAHRAAEPFQLAYNRSAIKSVTPFDNDIIEGGALAYQFRPIINK